MHIQPCHTQNSDTFRTQGVFKSQSNISDDQTYSECWHSQNSLLKHFQGYLGIFKDTDAYLANLKGAQLEWSGGGCSCLFLKILKLFSAFGKKTLIVFIFGLNFPFKI